MKRLRLGSTYGWWWEEWTGCRGVVEGEQPGLADGRVVSGREMEESRMTQLLGYSNSPCRLSNMLVFPIKPFLLFFLPLKSKEVRTLAKGVDFPRPRLDQPVPQSSLDAWAP